MWMQLISKTLILLLMFSFAYSQDNQEENAKPIEVDFLINYYQQDGNHSAVTGGEGTEELTNVAPMIIVNVPIGDNNLSVNGGIDVYSSASSDNIDPEVSGASKGDNRIHFDLGYTINNIENDMSYGIRLGWSNEYDYESWSFGANWSKGFFDNNSEIALTTNVYFDNISLINPFELRPPSRQVRDDDGGYKSDSRDTYDFSATFSQVLSKKSQISLNVQAVYQKGYLSTPFHRVYFNNNAVARIENLPNTRFKLPIGLRFNHYLNDIFILKTYYRYYGDDFGLKAHTANLEVPIRLSQSFTVIPGFRYHTQNGIDYFYEKGPALDGIDYYTSDFDLSSFNSQKYGLTLRYYPLSGISDFNMPLDNSTTYLKRIDLRAAYYDRSDGLNAFTVSLGIGFSIH
jgi:uncharacterized protein DUF3570